MILTSQDPACRKTLAKLLWVHRDLKRQGKLALHGHPVSLNKTDVSKTWAAARERMAVAS